MNRHLRWGTRDAVFAATLALPASLVIIFGEVHTGLALLFGSLPAAIVGLAPRRKERLRLIIVGILFGLFIMLGSFVAQWWWLAIPAMFLFGYGAAQLAALKPFGMIALMMGAPLAGIGLSYAGLHNSTGLAVLLVTGSVVAAAIALLFPIADSGQAPEARPLPKVLAQDYGVRLGLAGATAAAVGFGLGLDHIGWIAGAALFVMRPNMQTAKARAIGRIASVFVGALLASWLLSLRLEPVWIALVAAGALVLAAGTHKSEWYVTPLFTTFLVFWLLLYGDATQASIEHRFWQRVLETLAGVTIAVLFGIVWPTLASRFQRKHV